MQYVERARAVSERGEVVLRQRIAPNPPPGSPAALELRVNGVFVLASDQTSSEELLARATLGLVDRPDSVLVGGLGLGYTAREVLADPRVRHVTVAEIEASLVAWFRDGTVPHGPGLLADSRLAVKVADVGTVVADSAPGSVDLILLDVDNGPDYLVYPQNADLYTAGFLQRARRALRPGGVVGVWSATESPRLIDALRDVFGDNRTQPVPVLLEDREHTYWLHSAQRA